MFNEKRFMELIVEATGIAFTEKIIPLIVKSQELPEFVPTAQAMSYCNIKSPKTWKAKAEKYELKPYTNKLKGTRCYKKEDIVKLYALENQLLANF